MPTTILSDQFAQLKGALHTTQVRLDDKLEFRAEVKKSQEEAATKAVKRARHEKHYTFRKKRNEGASPFQSVTRRSCLGSPGLDSDSAQ